MFTCFKHIKHQLFDLFVGPFFAGGSLPGPGHEPRQASGDHADLVGGKQDAIGTQNMVKKWPGEHVRTVNENNLDLIYSEKVWKLL